MRAWRAVSILLMAGVLGGCVHRTSSPPTPPLSPVVATTALGQLQVVVDTLRNRSRHGDAQATAQLQALLSGKGLTVAVLHAVLKPPVTPG